MKKYRTNPRLVNAVQYKEYGVLVEGMCNSVYCRDNINKFPHVHTIHDNQYVTIEVGDYIIEEPDGGHYYPVKPDIFEQNYKLA